MSVNRYLPHLLVLPEDDADRQLANGFLLETSLVPRRLGVEPIEGGWHKVLDCFKNVHVQEMTTNPNRHMVLLIDFDEQPDRLTTAKDSVPDHLTERVFILGVWSEPEKLKRMWKSYEEIGQALAKDCCDGTNETWGHELLKHNAGEVARLKAKVSPFLFR